MNARDYKLRRAIVSDLGELRKLWQTAKIYSLELEPRFTEFQIAVNKEGDIVAAIGFEINDKQARLHSEAYATPQLAEGMRELFWDRIKKVSDNHGLFRLVTEPMPHWKEKGFSSMEPGVTQRKVMEAFGPQAADWLMLPLKDETEMQLIAEQEFLLFKQANAQDRERIKAQAQTMKNVAAVIAFLVMCLIMGGVIYYQKVIRAKQRGGGGAPTPAPQVQERF